MWNGLTTGTLYSWKKLDQFFTKNCFTVPLIHILYLIIGTVKCILWVLIMILSEISVPIFLISRKIFILIPGEMSD